MLRASAGSRLTWLRVTMRLIVRSQFSGVARRYEIRDMRFFSSLRWHDPHLARTRSLCTGYPSAGAAGSGVWANSGPAPDSHSNMASPQARGVTLLRLLLRSLMKDPPGDEQ